MMVHTGASAPPGQSSALSHHGSRAHGSSTNAEAGLDEQQNDHLTQGVGSPRGTLSRLQDVTPQRETGIGRAQARQGHRNEEDT